MPKFEGTPKIRSVGGHDLVTFTKQFVSCNVIEAEAGTNGYCGGDSGHDSRTYFRITDLSSTDMEITDSVNELEVRLGGDCELSTIIEALRYIADTLEAESNN